MVYTIFITDNNSKKKLYGPFLWSGFNCLKARVTSRRQLLLIIMPFFTFSKTEVWNSFKKSENTRTTIMMRWLVPHLHDTSTTVILRFYSKPKNHYYFHALGDNLYILQSFSYKNLCESYKNFASRSWPILFTLSYFFLCIHSPLLLENEVVLIDISLSKLDRRPLFNDIYITRLF